MTKMNNIGRRGFIKGLAGGAAGAVLSVNSVASPRIFPIEKSNTSFGIPDFNSYQDEEDFWKDIRKQFPLTDSRIFLNSSGYGAMPEKTVDAINQKTMEAARMSESGHGTYNQVRRKAAGFLHCDEDEIAITRNTTEGINLVARGLPLKDGDEVLLSTHEHPGGAQPWLAIAKEMDLRIKLFDPGMSNQENLDIIESNINSSTRVLCISHATCTTGLKFPAPEISEICKSKNIFFVLDGAHPPGMMPIDLHETKADFYATSGHKYLLGPKGTGLLYINENMFDIWKPRYAGPYADSYYDLPSKTLEFKEEASVVEVGTRSVELAAGLGASIDFLNEIGYDRVTKRTREMSNYLKEKLQEINTVDILTPFEEEASGTTVTFKPKNGSRWSVQRELSSKYKIRLRGVSEAGLGGIRVSVHIYNTYEELDILLEGIKDIT